MTPYQNKKLYDLIHPQLIQGDTVTLDSSGVRICIPPFINFSIGYLLKDITLETFNELLNITNLNPISEQTMQLVITNSYEYWTNENVKNAVNAILTKLSEEGG